jgi:phosphonopyruvate decarboxylase
MIPAEAVMAGLKQRGYSLLAGVPCSYFMGVIDLASADLETTYVPAADEGAALAIAAGATLGGARAAVLLQNSGLGNLINPLSSLALVYEIPLLLFISTRGYPHPDEPQHRIMAGQTIPILDCFQIEHQLIPDSVTELESALDRAAALASGGRSFALLIPKGSIGEARAAPPPPERFPMSRRQALGVIARLVEPDDLLIATTGMASRELMADRDRPENFYMTGSMGHAMALGLGLALEAPARRVVVLDGDGSVLMHMGTLSTIAHLAPPNFLHVVLDNEAYGSTGDQATTSSTTDLAAVAAACGYRRVDRCSSEADLEAKAKEALRRRGPQLLLVKVNREQDDAQAPRITSSYSLEEVAERFSRVVAGTRPARAASGGRR